MHKNSTPPPTTYEFLHRHGKVTAAKSSPSSPAWVSRLILMSSADIKLERCPFCGRGRAPVRVGESIERGGLNQGLGRSVGLPGSPAPERSRQSPARSPAKSASAQMLQPAPPPAARQQSHSSSQRWPGEARGITGGGQSQPIATVPNNPAKYLRGSRVAPRRSLATSHCSRHIIEPHQ